MIIDGNVAVRIADGAMIRAVGPLGERQCRDWINRQEHPSEWVALTVETVGTINEWETILREEGVVIYDYDGFHDWKQEWAMTRAEFDRRVGACTVGPAHSLDPKGE